MSEKKEIYQLEKFVHAIKIFIYECKKTGRINHQGSQAVIPLAPKIKKQVKEIDYESGKISKLQTETITLLSPSWNSVSNVVVNCIVNSDHYIQLINHLENINGLTNVRKTIQIFVKKSTNILLEDEDNTNKGLNELISVCVDSLWGIPPKYGSEGFIYGIALNVNSIQINFNDSQILIRQLVREDFEFDGSIEDFVNLEKDASFVPIMPSAKLKIEFNDISGEKIYSRTQTIMVLLRLFKVGSVDYNQMKEYSNSLVDEAFVSVDENNYKTSITHYISGIGNFNRAVDSYRLGNEDVSNLNKFIEILFNKIPLNFYSPNLKKDYLSLAYDRYTSALLDGRSSEYRIATAVMGLESIYLTENTELKYRLGIRSARVLGFWSDRNTNFLPANIRELMGFSYDIRSAFVHGDEPVKSLLNKLKNKCSNINNLLILTLDYLRVSIILCLILDLNKKDFVSQIDNSLIDENHLNSLKEKLLSVKSSISVKDSS